MPFVAVAMRFLSMRARSSRKNSTSAAPAMTKTTPALSVKGCTAISVDLGTHLSRVLAEAIS
jgi:hypothetical protein